MQKNSIPKYWYNIVPYLEHTLKLKVPKLLNSKTKKPMTIFELSKILPTELAKQELNFEKYKTERQIKIPRKIYQLYKTYRRTPLVRAEKLEKALNLTKVKIYYKREDVSPIHSYKLNSSDRKSVV